MDGIFSSLRKVIENTINNFCLEIVSKLIIKELKTDLILLCPFIKMKIRKIEIFHRIIDSYFRNMKNDYIIRPCRIMNRGILNSCVYQLLFFD